MNERRLACIHLPDFPLVLYSRLHPEVRAHPLVLTTAEGETATVTICNARAAQYDVAAGMTVARANSLCPGLVIGVRECGRETAVLREIGGALAGVGPEIEIETGGVIFLESARLGKLYGDEPGLARRIQAVLQPFGYPVAIGFAANKFVALTAARQAAPGGWVIVPSGSESAWLQQLQVEHLALSDDTAETLSDLGIATVGQAAALPANEVVERFGAEGAVLARRARGDDPEPFTPDRPAADWCATAGLDSPVRDAATILAHIEALLKHLLAQPGCAGCAVREIQVCLHLDDRTEQVFTAAVEQPSAAAARFLRQVRLALERMSPAAAVRDITLRIPHPAAAAAEQTAFAQPGARGEIDAETAATIRRTLSGNRLCTARLLPSHLPERAFRLSPVTPSPAKRPSASSLSAGAAPLDRLPPYSLRRIAGLRLLQPPQPAEVHPADGWLRDGSGKHRVTGRRGPWKLSGDWWQTGFDRLYYELQTEEHRQYLVFFDRSRARWFVQGVFD